MLAILLALGHGPSHGQMLSERDAQIYRGAFEAADQGAWSRARQQAARANDALLAKVILWMELLSDNGDQSFERTAAFIRENPAWPNQAALRLQAESRMPPGTSSAAIVAWFDDAAPQTVDGVMRYGAALAELGRREDAVALVRERWIDIALTRDQQSRVLAQFGGALTADDHRARLDNMLWEERASEARSMLPLVDAGRRAVTEARLRLAGQSGGVDAALAAVPAALVNDEGLVYDRVRWRRREDRTEGAIELLAQQPTLLTRPEPWWTERNILARRLFNEGDYAGAYALVSDHRQTDPTTLAEAEWLAGWLAFRFLNQPDLAADHFRKLYASVSAPISLARGAYWLGRTYDAAGDTAQADYWYRHAAQYDSVFYGQLAAGEIGLPSVNMLAQAPEIPPDAINRFEANELVRIVRALHQIDEDGLVALFLQKLLGTYPDPINMTLTGRLALQLDYQNIAVRVGKQAMRNSLMLVELAFPVQPTEAADRRVDPALLLALIRQESEFNKAAVSSAGARGLMQLMPATAKSVARQYGLSNNERLLTTDANHNIRLGSAYLGDLIERFRGSYVLSIAGYNGGPNRVAGWLDTMGDPRGGRMELYDVIDWIEAIPIYETRNYVQRVLENTQVYRARLGGKPVRGALERDLLR